MQSNSLTVILAASFVFHCIITGGEASVVERGKRDDNEWIVTTLIEKPYVIRKRQPALSNEDYEGYIPDVLKKIGEKLNQKYRIREVPDGRYGFYDNSKRTWTGLIGELTQVKADLAAAPITVNSERRDVVDFTIPFMTFGTVILLLKNTSDPAGPKTVHDLLTQTDLRYGVVKDGSTDQLIQRSSDPDLSLLRQKLVPVDKQDDGVTRVRTGQGKFAFVIEEKTGKFWKRQEACDLMTIPVTQLEPREYALALKKGSLHTEKINRVLQELKDSGDLDALERKWWSGPCSAASGTFGTITLALAAALGAMFHSVKF